MGGCWRHSGATRAGSALARRRDQACRRHQHWMPVPTVLGRWRCQSSLRDWPDAGCAVPRISSWATVMSCLRHSNAGSAVLFAQGLTAVASSGRPRNRNGGIWIRRAGAAGVSGCGRPSGSAPGGLAPCESGGSNPAIEMAAFAAATWAAGALTWRATVPRSMPSSAPIRRHDQPCRASPKAALCLSISSHLRDQVRVPQNGCF